MTVWVGVASRHGATQGLAEAIGRTLTQQGLDVEVKRIESIDRLCSYQAVVLGSAV